MADRIGINQITLKYATLEEAKKMPGLRLILGANTVPGPWREACKGIFYVKKIPYTPVASAGSDGSPLELIEWTAQASAPVAIWNDERPRSTWVEQLYLAERLQPDPALIPANLDERISMLGIINEICGENGFAWSKRLMMIDAMLSNSEVNPATRNFWQHLGGKYGYRKDAAHAAPARIIEVLECLALRLERQKAKGSQFFIGDGLSALDIYWAAFAGLVRPLPPELCPMASAFRDVYSERNPAIAAAISPILLEHRDFIYREYLELPVVF